MAVPQAGTSMTQPVDIQELVLSLYDTVLDPERWPTVLQRVADLLGGAGAIIFERTDREEGWGVRASHLSASYHPRALEAYLARFANHELDDQLLFEQTSMLSDRVELVSDEIVRRDGDALSTRPNARFLKAFGLRHRAAALLDKDNPSRDRFSIQFAIERGPITIEEIALASLILPHIAKTLAIARYFHELNASKALALNSLDRLQVGVAITDHSGRPLFENNEFKRIIEEHDVIGRDRVGRLILHEAHAQAKLAGLLHDIRGHGRFGARPRKEAVIVEQDEAVAGLCLEACPLTRAEDVGTAPIGGYLVTCLDTRAISNLDLGTMSRTFGLTGAEERVLGRLVDGLSNAQIAEFSSRSVETVNSQVKALLAKTGCENRTQLVRLATSLCQRMTNDRSID